MRKIHEIMVISTQISIKFLPQILKWIFRYPNNLFLEEDWKLFIFNHEAGWEYILKISSTFSLWIIWPTIIGLTIFLNRVKALKYVTWDVNSRDTLREISHSLFGQVLWFLEIFWLFSKFELRKYTPIDQYFFSFVSFLHGVSDDLKPLLTIC